MIVGREDNQKPIANAGEDKTIKVGDKITLDGSKSYDPDGNIIEYRWVYKKNSYSKSTHTSNNPITSFIPDLDVGEYIVTLTVRDNDGGTEDDTIKLTVIN